MKRSLLAIILLLTVLTSCVQGVEEAKTTPVTTTTSVTTTATTTTTSTEPDPKPPATTAPITTAPPELPSAPVFGDVDLSEIDRDNRSIVYTTEKSSLYSEDGKIITELDAGFTLILLAQTEDYAVILYKDNLCLIKPLQITQEIPAKVIEQQNTLGGIYYPAGEILIAIDAGHQGKAMKEKEPLGPGSDELKAMVSSGTQGVSTRIPERELNLQVSLLLRDELLSRGYSVLMIRESHDVTISNAQRAKVANDYGADAFIRVHANGSDDRSVRGAMTICQTTKNPYNGALYAQSRRLSDCILDNYCIATGIQKNNVWETDTMTGINWAETPVTIVEMGYMSNAEEDELMATDAFRKTAAVGMANGLDAYFGVINE